MDNCSNAGGSWFKLLEPTTSVPADYGWGVVGGDTVVDGVNQPFGYGTYLIEYTKTPRFCIHNFIIILGTLHH